MQETLSTTGEISSGPATLPSTCSLPMDPNPSPSPLSSSHPSLFLTPPLAGHTDADQWDTPLVPGLTKGSSQGKGGKGGGQRAGAKLESTTIVKVWHHPVVCPSSLTRLGIICLSSKHTCANLAQTLLTTQATTRGFVKDWPHESKKNANEKVDPSATL